MSEHTLKYGLKAREFDIADFQDESVKRILKKLSDIDRAALDKAELEEVRWHRDTEAEEERHSGPTASGSTVELKSTSISGAETQRD